MAVLSAVVSAPLQAQTEIDNLVTTSQSIRDTFSYGIKTIAGGESYAWQGGISPSMAKDGHVSAEQQNAYNAAVAAVQNATYSYDPGAQQFFQEQGQQAMDTVSEMIDAYVQAASVLITVATINERAQAAQSAPDEREAMALQEYIEANDVILDDQEVMAYNDALTNTEEAIQTAASYFAVANDPALIDEADDAARTMMVTYAESSQVYFDALVGTVNVAWDGQTMTVALNVGGYFKSAADILTEGETQPFYTTSPEGGCWFIEDPAEKDVCLYGS